MKRRNNYYYQRWILSGFAGVITIMFIHLLCFPLNQKEPSSLNWFEQIIANSDLQKPASDGDFWGYITTSLRIAITPIISSLFGLSLLSLSLNKRNNNTTKNQYLKNKKTNWTILTNGVLFVLLFPTGLILLIDILIIIQGKEIIWHTLPQAFLIGMGIGLIIYIFLLFVSD
ncbi:MAG: hypothetical protein AAFS12_18475 [Cyanobacteria bacterium J06632_19]